MINEISKLIITWNQFHNDVDRLSLCANSYKFDNIGMIILLENSAREKIVRIAII